MKQKIVKPKSSADFSAFFFHAVSQREYNLGRINYEMVISWFTGRKNYGKKKMSQESQGFGSIGEVFRMAKT